MKHNERDNNYLATDSGKVSILKDCAAERKHVASPTTLSILSNAYCHGKHNLQQNPTDDYHQSNHHNDAEGKQRLITNNERVLISLAAGALAGAVAKSTIAPLDRSKIYFQTTPATPFSFNNVLTYLYKSYKLHGVSSLWRGNSATMARIIPYAAIQFSAHEQYKYMLNTDSERTSELTRFICGALAGVTAQSLTYPLDLTRARLAVSPVTMYDNLVDVFVKTIRKEGVLGLYKGYIPTMLGVIPYAGCSFYCYEGLKRVWVREFGEGSVGALERLLFGAISGIIGQSSSYPFDIVRRRLQTGVVGGNGTSVINMMVDIVRNEGVVGGLYKGLSLNWVKGPVAAGISFAMFDWSYATLRDWVAKR